MRATQAPEQWRKLLNAVANNDYDLAHHICVTYEFNGVDGRTVVREKPKVSTNHYVAMSPYGDVYHHEYANELSKSLGLSEGYVISNIRTTGGRPVRQGKMKGWTFWKQISNG